MRTGIIVRAVSLLTGTSLWRLKVRIVSNCMITVKAYSRPPPRREGAEAWQQSGTCRSSHAQTRCIHYLKLDEYINAISIEGI